MTAQVRPGEGVASRALRIPHDDSLLGAVFHVQWAVLNPPGSASLGAVSRGLEVTVVLEPGAGSPPKIDSITPSTVPALMPGPEQSVSIAGSWFTPETVVSVDGVALTGSPAPFTVVGPELITLDMPPVDQLGPVEIQVTTQWGWAAGEIAVAAPELPQLQAGTGAEPVLVTDDSVGVLMSSLPDDLFLLYGSFSGLPSVLPGTLELEIGSDFASLFPLGSYPIDPLQGWTQLDVGLVGVLPPFTQFFLEGIVIRATGLAFPLDTSNRQEVVYLF